MNDSTRDPVAVSGYVAALERQNRILRVLAAACLGLTVVVAICGATVIPEGLIIQEEFILRDRAGTTRFEMVVHDVNGRSNGLHIVDMNGKTRIDIGITPAGEPIIAFLDGAGRVIRTLP